MNMPIKQLIKTLLFSSSIAILILFIIGVVVIITPTEYVWYVAPFLIIGVVVLGVKLSGYSGKRDSQKEQSQNKKALKKYKELIEICICKHGKIHHNGEFAECTYPIEIKQYNYQPCNCPNYKMNLNDFRNKQIIEWNEKVEHQNTLGVNSS